MEIQKIIHDQMERSHLTEIYANMSFKKSVRSNKMNQMTNDNSILHTTYNQTETGQHETHKIQGSRAPAAEADHVLHATVTHVMFL